MTEARRGSAPWKIAVVGAGRVGLVFGRVLLEGGDRITAVVSRTRASARRGAQFLRCRTAGTDPAAIPAATDLVLITTPHGAVEAAARTLAGIDHLPFPRMAFCHASGMLTAGALAPLAARGATVFSFHPLQTFPRDFAPAELVPSLAGIWYGVDGDPRGLRFARRLARRLGGKTVEIPAELRVFYHAACVVASNHLTALAGVLETMHEKLGLRRPGAFELFKPIMEATLRNIQATSPAEALSGPVARGGVETIARHREAVRQAAPELMPYFDAMTLETVRLALRKGSITGDQARAFEALTGARPASATRTESSQ